MSEALGGPCATDGRPLWDIEANEASHRTAAWVCNRRCPVKDACMQAAESTPSATGLFAGLIWKRVSGRHVAVSVDQHHSRRRRPKAKGSVKKVCALEGCNTTFVTHPMAPGRKYCGEQHRSRAKYLMARTS